MSFLKGRSLDIHGVIASSLVSVALALAPHSLADVVGEPADPEPSPRIFEPYPRDPGDERMPYWWRALESEGFVSAVWTHENESDGTDVEGLKLTYGARGSGDDMMATVDGWVSIRQGGELEVYGLGVELVPILYFRPWLGLGPTMNVGLEYRTESPYQGWGGFLGVGAEAMFYLGRHWQVSLGAERDFGISTNSRNMFHFSFGFGHPQLGPENERPSSGDI